MKCNQKNCENEAAFKFTWPGKDEAGICANCLPMVRNLANAIGMYLQIRPLTVEDLEPQTGGK